MRRLAVLIVLAAAGPLSAQAPPAAPVTPPDPVLVQHLQGWEKTMAASRSFYSECVTVKEDVAQKSKFTYKGFVMCLKPGYAKNHIDLTPEPGRPAEPGVFEEYVVTQTRPNAWSVFEYNGTGQFRETGKDKPKTATEHRFPPGERPRNVLMDFLSGAMTADAAFKRFDLQLAREGAGLKPGEAVDPNYVYIQVRPRTNEDKVDFDAMTLVLYRPTSAVKYGYLPARVKFSRQFGQSVEDWTFSTPVLDHPNVVPAQFQPRPLGPDWVSSVRAVPPGGAGAPGQPAGRVPAPGGAPAAPAGLPRP